MMEFHYTSAFFGLIPYSLLILLFGWARWRRRRDLQRIGDWMMIRHLVNVEALFRRRRKNLFLLSGLLFLLFSLTGPQFGNKLKEVKHRGVEVFIAMDTSRSMLAEDVAPSRLERAKRSLGLLIQKLNGNRIGIIAFAKDAIVQCPLTTDNEATHMFLDIIDQNTTPRQGTSIGDAIRLALQSFPKEEKTGRAIVLLTDGEDHESNPMEAAKLAKEAGVVIFTIGIGTTKGEVIKNRDTEGKVVEFHKYKGEMVISRLDDAALTKIAMLTGGHYYRASSGDTEIDEIADALNGMDKKLFTAKIHERLEERYQFFALIGLLLLLLEFFYGENPGQGKRIQSLFRPKTTAVLLLLALLPHYAWADVKTHLRTGNELMKKGDTKGARAEFESARIDAPEEAILPYNIAATYYLEGDLESARKSYESAMALAKDPQLKSKIAYNWGHLLFSMNEGDKAIDKFKECLRLNPKDVDAKYNIEYIKAGNKPPAPPQKQDKKDESKKDDKKSGESSDDTNKDKGQQDDQNKDNQSSEPEEEKGSMSKEDAERVLEMLQAQESEKMKDTKPIQGQISPKEKNNVAGEDW